MVTVTYECPRCGALADLERDAYLADRCVTPEPLADLEYANASDEFAEADGVEIVCGAGETRGEGCGAPYYLSFVTFEDGEAVEPPRSLEDDPRFDFLR